MLKASIISAVIWGATTANAATVQKQAQQVAILDTITFTPALERVSARPKVEDAVASTVRAHGWEPVAVASDCRDLTCAGTVAAQAKVSYVLILVGRFVPTDTYATDVGVVLWRDGAVVGTRTETQEDAERGASPPVPARCGPPDGTCTPQLLQSKLQAYAAQVLEAEKTAVEARRLAAAPVPTTTTSQVIAPVAPPPVAEGGRAGRIVGWSLLGAGVVLGGGAVGFWVADGAKTHCSPAAARDGDGCRYQWHTSTPAIVFGVAGAAAAAAGVVLLISDRPASRLALTVHASGFAFEGSF